ncbi:hypothetical protein [Bradyrhizobium sp. Leo170]|uniref:hypothetical protein n=1 Tax=Bradyrhizobium sp. Leo170 TaxID=1571199 RepID=UPI001FE23460|nr:hypothetical protein [Bradyrhizobium sp. Leo170]
MLCFRRLFPDEFPKDVPNPWVGVTMKTRVKKKKPAVTRDEVYTFAHGCIDHHKTGEIVDHPLEDGDVKFYEEAEEVLSHLKRLGTPMILYEVEEGKEQHVSTLRRHHSPQVILQLNQSPQ